jgi:GT2 family glycosyltransferase
VGCTSASIIFRGPELDIEKGYDPVTKIASSGRKRLVAVVVTHNRLAQLQTTLTRLLDEDAEILQAVVVLDNASCDGTSVWLADQSDPRLVYQSSAHNIGGAGGFEAGMKLASSRFDPDWMVLMDDDARPRVGALSAFQDMHRPDDHAAAAAVYFPGGQICEMNRPSVNPFWSLRAFMRTLFRGRDGYHIPVAAYAADTAFPVDLTSFVGLFLSRRMVAEVGFPNPRLFLYGDDVIYSLEVRGHGFRISFEPTIEFEHDCSTFQNDQRRVFQPIWKVYYAYRNALIMYRTAAGGLFWPLLPVLALKWRLNAGRYGEDRGVYLRLMYAALCDGARGRMHRDHEAVLALAHGGANASID